ncbi:MAG: YciI family protein [Pseudomonadota bacterium]|nr:YciI family protein [Pseudomonadota bacterium]
MFFLMENIHHPGKQDDRDRLRPQHRDWVGSGGHGLCSVLIGSALWDAEGEAIGHWGVLEAASEEDARKFSEGDPFYAEGVVATLNLTRLADGFQAHRIAERMSPAIG